MSSSRAQAVAQKTPPATDDTSPEKTPHSEKSGSIPKAPAPRSRRWGWILILLLLAVFVGAGLALVNLNVLAARYPILAGWLPTAHLSQVMNKHFDAVDTQLENHEDRLTQLEAQVADLGSRGLAALPANTSIVERLSSLEAQINALSPPEDDLSQSARIDMLLSRMTQLEGAFIPLSRNLIDAEEARQDREALRVANAALQTKLDVLAARLAAVEAFTAQDNHAAILAWQASSLRRGVLSGQAYRAELTQLQQAATDMGRESQLADLLTPLDQWADGGLITLADLQARLQAALPQVQQAALSAPDPTWWQQTLNTVRGLVIVRNRKDQNGNDLDSVLNRMEQALARGDIARVQAEKANLDVAPRNALADWWQDVDSYATAMTLLGQLEGRLQAKLMPKTSADEVAE